MIERVGRRLSKELGRVSWAVEQWAIRRAVMMTAGPQAPHIFSYTLPDELCALYTLGYGCPQNAAALEIGAHVGASTCFLAAGLSVHAGHLFSVDTWLNHAMPDGNQDTFGAFQHNTRFLRNYITALRKRSEDLEKTDLRVPLALAFIDGDHSYDAVHADFQRVATWMAPSGVVAFHDASRRFPGVTQVIGAALKSGDWLIGGRVQTLFWIKRKN